MTDPIPQVVATYPASFTPAFSLRIDGLLLEGTKLESVYDIKRTWQQRHAVSMEQIARLAELPRYKVYVFPPSPQVPLVPASEPLVAATPATRLWLQHGPADGIIFGHPYADVRRLWNEYLDMRRLLKAPV